MATFEEQRRLADVLRGQAMQPIQGNGAPISWTQGLNQLAQGFFGGRLANMAEQGEQKQERLKATELDQFMRALKGERAASPMMPGVMPSFRTPEVQGLAAQAAMSDAERQAEFRNDVALQAVTPEVPPAELATFNAMTADMTPEDKAVARRIWAGLSPRAVGSAAQTIGTTPGMTQTVAGSEAAIRGAVTEAEETARLTVQGDLRPRIEADVAAAKAAAEAQGQAFTERARLEASLPGLNDVVARLRALSEVATYTRSGQAFNAVARELGFQPSEGATARAAYIATIDNEILPLLRETFGAQFTEREGQSLKATLGDPNMSPAEKNAVLDAFIAAKIRNLETRSTVQGAMGTPPQVQQPAAQPPIPLEELGDVDAILRREGYLQ